MASPAPKRIGTLLVENGLISEAHLEEALRIQQEREGKIVEILISLGYVDPNQFVDFLAKQPGIAGIDINRYGVSEELIKLVPREFALKHEVFPLDRIGSLLTVGMVCPLDTKTIQELEQLTGLRVKPLLVAAEDLRRSIERYYEQPEEEDEEAYPEGLPQGAEMRLAGTAYLVRQLDALPALPPTVQRIQEAVGDVEVLVSDIARLINTDPPLAAKVLAVANSPAYGFPNKVASVELAVSLLGLRETYHIALSVAVADVLTSAEGFNYKQFWTRSYIRAALAKSVARHTGHGNDPAPFTAGLLADVGRLVLAQVAPGSYHQLAEMRDGQKLVEAEEKLLGIGHPEAGYLLTEAWGLPGALTEAIRFHHMPERAQTGLIAVWCIAVADAYIAIPPNERANGAALTAKCATNLKVLGASDEHLVALLPDMDSIIKGEFILRRRWDLDVRKSSNAASSPEQQS